MWWGKDGGGARKEGLLTEVSLNKFDDSGQHGEVGGDLPCVGLEVFEVADRKERSGSLSESSFWKRARFLIMSFENSRGPLSPWTTGCANGSQRREQTARKLTMSRAATWPSESHTALQKVVQSHMESDSLMLTWWIGVDEDSSLSDGGRMSGRGEAETIDMDSARV